MRAETATRPLAVQGNADGLPAAGRSG